jgi:hypothetical protein
VTKTGIIAAVFAAAAIIFVVLVARGMRDSGFIIQAYGIAAIVLAGYTWSLARRLSQAKESGPPADDVGP